MEERTEERTEERSAQRTEETEERTEDIEEGLEVTGEACKAYKRCEEESECHLVAKRARVCAWLYYAHGSTTDTEHLESSVLRESRNTYIYTRLQDTRAL